jgi:hypothetical protein
VQQIRAHSEVIVEFFSSFNKSGNRWLNDPNIGHLIFIRCTQNLRRWSLHLLKLRIIIALSMISIRKDTSQKTVDDLTYSVWKLLTGLTWLI